MTTKCPTIALASPSRRSFLQGLSVALPAAAAPTAILASPAEHPALLELGAELERIERAWTAAGGEREHLPAATKAGTLIRARSIHLRFKMDQVFRYGRFGGPLVDEHFGIGLAEDVLRTQGERVA